ncbi:NAD(P)H-dependent oxidoreductase [Actinocorallia sp. A-T 12471]|uniref:NAD(P)H-dependent oxidoreductase n=1 Tax=Actinocorallia sp. A-T 12471 TaxID=3089813 RepID=UPI0029D3F74B|nr:NAD(P)H-dependent oxidoreductase [Actinocorallia sp. A-T 12471]MDX6744670.1 NAD(P)H-dependent oxidoreductase [Actinocorallia sp. A-T 12471]
MNLFRLDASIFPANSASSEIADRVEAEWAAAHPGGTIVRRHLGTDPLPADAWALATLGGFAGEADRTPEQSAALALAAELAAELEAADAVVLAVPFYNFGVAQQFKIWTDLVIAAAGPGAALLKGTPTVLATTLGGGYGPGTPRDGWDHSTPYLERILGDLWQADLTVIKRELTLAATNPEMEPLRGLAAERHALALDAAREAGRALAGN